MHAFCDFGYILFKQAEDVLRVWKYVMVTCVIWSRTSVHVHQITLRELSTVKTRKGATRRVTFVTPNVIVMIVAMKLVVGSVVEGIGQILNNFANTCRLNI